MDKWLCNIKKIVSLLKTIACVYETVEYAANFSLVKAISHQGPYTGRKST